MADRDLSLYSALKIGSLRDERKQRKILKEYGYKLDTRLSDGRQTIIAVKPNRKEVLFIENGTDPNNSKDILTDFQLVTGGLTGTNRYKETKAKYNLAKEKYPGAQFKNVGYSLGGALVNEITRPEDKAVVYNSAFLKNAPVKKNVSSLRIEGDPVSIYSPPETTRLLVNPYENPGGLGTPNFLLKTHKIDALKGQEIFL